MNSERLDKLLIFLKDDPTDPFIIYAIATEYNGFDTDKALAYYELLLHEHEIYLATYYHLGKLYADLKEVKKATEVFKKGIVLAKSQKKSLALRELQNAYNELLFDE